MKKAKIKIASLLIAPVLLTGVLAPSIYFGLKNQNNQQQTISIKQTNENLQTTPTKTYTDETELIDALEESTDFSRIVNNIKVTRPSIAGQEDYVVLKKDEATVFNPLDYGYLVYDAIDPNPIVTYTGIDNVNLSTVGDYTFTISAVNKYKLKSSKTFTIKVVDQETFNQKRVFKYSAYVLNGGMSAQAVSASDYTTTEDWQLALPVIVKRGQKIRFKQTNPNFDINRSGFSVYRGLNSYASLPNNLRKPKARPLLNLNNFTYDPATGWYTEQLQERWNHDGIYIFHTPRMEYEEQNPVYEIEVINQDGSEVADYSQNTLVNYFVFKDSDNTTREDAFMQQWLASQNGAVIRTRATTVLALNEDNIALYRGKKEGRNFAPEPITGNQLKEISKSHEYIQDMYFKIHGMHRDVIHQPWNVAINSSALMTGWWQNNDADAWRFPNFGFFFNKDTFSVNQNKIAHVSGLWINNTTNGDIAPDYFKHEYGHSFQNRLQKNASNLVEVTNIFSFLYVDYTVRYEEELKKIKANENTRSLDEEEQKKLAAKNTWADMRYLSSFYTTKVNPILNTYESAIPSNKRYYKYFFTNKFYNYYDMRHVIFPKVFARFGWEALTYVYNKHREILAGVLNVPGITKNSSNNDFFVYFMSEYTKHDLSTFFDHFGVTINPELKNVMLHKGWPQLDMLNLMSTDNKSLQSIIDSYDYLFYRTSIATNDELKADRPANATLSVYFNNQTTTNPETNESTYSGDYLNVKNQIIKLLKINKDNTVTEISKLPIINQVVVFNNLQPGLYKILSPSYTLNDDLKYPEIATFSVADNSFTSVNIQYHTYSQPLWIAEQTKNQNLPTTEEDLIKYALPLLDLLNNSKIDIKDHKTYFAYERAILTYYRDRLMELNSNSELITQINVYLNKYSTQLFSWKPENPNKISVNTNSNFVTIMNNFKLYIPDNNDVEPISVNLKNIKDSDLIFDEQNKPVVGVYHITFTDEKNNDYVVEIEVVNA
ncbi:M60 family metallopeptidase [Ureaplasma sp. ES3154-GEN]|uniref:M60 family metallopeptidase n=1 Tax=Ureaplasma sp. ES3154-GEN TaxID=2984844 RepID=UPI0021E94DD7|nr:M60 family metallopeptidase [Ureaplasma sp. ES3154-GEN]MCV3743761.1 M60 family metallopeptidase [Ureaplasma sp. ES3154-GEN]